MKKFTYAALGLLVAVGLSLADTPALSLKLTALDPAVKSGFKIMIRVTTTNQSKHTITYHDTNRDCNYSVVVLTSAGTPAPESDIKRGLHCGDGFRVTGRDILVTLKPGEFTNEDEFEISRLYDMSAPGEYHIQVERTFPEIGHFRSNTVKVKVTP